MKYQTKSTPEPRRAYQAHASKAFQFFNALSDATAKFIDFPAHITSYSWVWIWK